jgi:hypothetical protein
MWAARSRLMLPRSSKTLANGPGVALATWTPPATKLAMPAVFPDVIEVRAMRDFGGATLVGAIELVSPGNKDRPQTRRAFVAKCASYLQQGVGLVVVESSRSRRRTCTTN